MASTTNVPPDPFAGRHPAQPQAGAPNAGRRRSRRVARAVSSALRPHLEAVESRVFLSAYTLKPLMGQFSVNATGANPRSTLIADASGNLFGTATTGGPYADGTVFEIANGSTAITMLASFDGTNGRNPVVGVVQDASGNLYGTTHQGGANDEGTVFELPAGSNSITTLASFDGSNGAGPQAGLTLDASGNLYGTTTAGGAYDSGTIFEIPGGSSGTLTTLASFNGLSATYGGLVLDASGNLYGTAASGGADNYGAVYRFIKATSSIQIWASFSKTDGAVPYAGLTCDAAGNLYGTTSQGGAYGDGTVFEMGATSAKITTLVSFNSTDGSGPLASV
ncbi:MAG TPA: choice-of-anchor tandem repeat GloVer-containing protein, partial [Tepidisphaeraceae bacterium]